MYDAEDTQARIRVETGQAGLALVRVAGEIDIVTVPGLRRCLDTQLRVARSLVLDLTGAGYFGAAGISVLLRTDDLAGRRGLPWALAGSRAVRRPLLVTGLADRLPLCEDVETALASVEVLSPA